MSISPPWHFWPRAAWAVARRPWLWRAALRFWPPSRAYIDFRLTTMYGEDHSIADPADVVVFLRWCRAFHREVRRSSKREAHDP